jgi:hypothetical protein
VEWRYYVSVTVMMYCGVEVGRINYHDSVLCSGGAFLGLQCLFIGK